MSNPSNHSDEHLLQAIQKLNRLVMVLLVAMAGILLVAVNRDRILSWFKPSAEEVTPVSEPASAALPADPNAGFWKAPDITVVSDPDLLKRIEYGRELIAHTAQYLGPSGSIAHISNGLNCQNCHLDAGTRVFGNNYGSVASTYPKFRARSGTEEDITKRVNDCFERSLNGKALADDSPEMVAIRSYIEFLGTNVEKGKKADGSGLKELPFLGRAADVEKGKQVYQTKCQSCHKEDGHGQKAMDGLTYTYPPLWGPDSYNDAAGLYRLSNFARFVKYNMPLGATHYAPQLSDEEAWDVAAFVNSQSRPHKSVPEDWPDKSKKPIDHPFGPYADHFSEKQHKFGPFQEIQSFYSK